MPPADWTEIGADQLDSAIATSHPRPRWIPVRRPALGLGATATPTLAYVLAGIALGPYGMNLLTPTVIRELNIASWVTLAVIGVLLGLGLVDRRRDVTGRSLISSSLIAAITIAIVAGGLLALIHYTGARLPGTTMFMSAALLGLCASVSAALPAGTGASPEVDRAAHLADYDDVPLLVFGTLIVAALAGPDEASRLLLTLLAGVGVAIAGWLLLERANRAERGLFVAGSVLLLAGVAARLGTSPLLTGCSAALIWRWAPGTTDRVTARDLRVLQHPLVALLLITAGAMIQWDPIVLWMTACLVLLRTGARLLASVAAGSVAMVAPALLATALMPPGVMGIALAVNVSLVAGADYQWIVSVVTGAAIVSESMAAFLPSPLPEAP